MSAMVVAPKLPPAGQWITPYKAHAVVFLKITATPAGSIPPANADISYATEAAAGKQEINFEVEKPGRYRIQIKNAARDAAHELSHAGGLDLVVQSAKGACGGTAETVLDEVLLESLAAPDLF